MKVTTRKKAPALDKPATGSASMQDASGSVQERIDKLEAAWEKSGGTMDRKEIRTLRRQLKEQKK